MCIYCISYIRLSSRLLDILKKAFDIDADTSDAVMSWDHLAWIIDAAILSELIGDGRPGGGGVGGGDDEYVYETRKQLFDSRSPLLGEFLDRETSDKVGDEIYTESVSIQNYYRLYFTSLGHS